MLGNEFWRLFDAVCCSNLELLRHVLSFLNAAERGSLRLSSRHLCGAVSGTVDRVVYSLHHDGLERELSAAFPAAEVFQLRIRPPSDEDDEDDERAVTATDVFIFLQHVSTLSPTFLQRLTRLEVDLVLEGDWSASTQSAFSRLLSRCTNLQALQVTWATHGNPSHPQVANFAGQGGTPELQRCHMQEQLSSFIANADFLAPSSWSKHLCLVELTLRSDDVGAHFESMCTNALSTSSLKDLTIHAQHASQLAVCKGLSRLDLLRLKSLRELGIDGPVLSGAGESTVPSSWSQLTGLTLLELWDCHLNLGCLPRLPLLQNLEIQNCTVSGCLTDLKATTALTQLQFAPLSHIQHASEGAASAAGQAQSGGAAVPAVPAEWWGGLRELWWQFSWQDMQVVSQLAALTSLHLGNAQVGPELCWHLAALPNLQALKLYHARAPEQPRECFATSFRALLPALKTLDPGSAQSLRELACWTDVPPGLALSTALATIDKPLAYHKLGAGWLAALLAAPAPATLVLGLRDDAALQHLLQMLRARQPSQQQVAVSLLLGQDVSPEALGLLLEAAPLFAHGSVHLADPVKHTLQLGFKVHDALSQAQYQQLRGMAAVPGLCRLRIDRCGEMLDRHVALIAKAAGGLRVLKLAKARRLTDSTLFALLCCEQLEEVRITGCQQPFTAPAVATLLDTIGQLRLLVVGKCAATEQVSQALGILGTPSRCAPKCLKDQWAVRANHAHGAEGVVRCELLE